MTMSRAVAVLLVCLAIAAQATAQSSSSGTARNAIDAAMRLGNAGDLGSARALIDSVIASSPADSPMQPEALFARATFASNVLDATLDYKKIIDGDSASPLRRESLLRMAQRALISGDAPRALDYLTTMTRDYPSDSSLAVAGYWTARALIENHDIVAACAANREALAHSRASFFFFAPLEAQAKVSCPAVAVPSVPVLQPTAGKPPGSTGARIKKVSGRSYAVQVAAYDVRSEAEQMSQRLRRSGLDSHVDGEKRPFRVRVGRFSSRAEAEQALRDLKARKLSGFVAVIDE
jgi:cell division septation protein DedD